MSNTDLNVALNEGAYKDLLDIWGILPSKLAAQLDASTPPKDSPSPTPTSRPVPYTVLLSISRWARTDSGRDALLAHQPPKDPRNFDMIALLAGSTTSPEKHFPTPVGGWAEEERTRKREMNDRRAITNVINAMLSIGGCGVATWYAAGVAGWQNEWVSRNTRISQQTEIQPVQFSSVFYLVFLLLPWLQSPKPCFILSGRMPPRTRAVPPS